MRSHLLSLIVACFLFFTSATAIPLPLQSSDPMEKDPPASKQDPVWDDIMLGLLSGFGYASLLLLPDNCEEAGFELAPSAYMLYLWYTTPDFKMAERILGPTADYIQMVLQVIFMQKCIKGKDTQET